MKQFFLAVILLGCLQELAWGNENIGEFPADKPFFNANKAAFVTTTSLAILTIAAAMGATAAAKTASTFSLVSYSVLAITGAATSIAAIMAWMDMEDNQSPTSAHIYFQKVATHAGVAIAGVYQFTAQILVMSIVQGLAQGTSRAISRSIGGEDQTIRIVQ